MQELLFVTNFDSFYTTFKSMLDNVAPLRKKKIRYYNQPFMTKSLRKTIMKRSKLKNKYSKDRSSENWCEYLTDLKI